MRKPMKLVAATVGLGIMSVSAVSVYAHAEGTSSLASGPVASHVTLAQPIVKTQSSGQITQSSKLNTHQSAATIDKLPLAGQTYYTNKVVIVTFHDIAPTPYSPWVVTPQQFSSDLDIIGEYFHVITNDQFIRFLDHKGTVPSNAVLLTFDDGYRGMYTYALPALVAHHMSGTFFVIVGHADKGNPLSMSWGQMQQMAHEGMSIESHTYLSHYEVPSGPHHRMVPVFNTRMMVNGKLESVQDYNRRVSGDFLRARMELQNNLGVPIRQFAWPYGWGVPMATYIAHKVGYEYLYTTQDGFVTQRTNRSLIPRIDIGKELITPQESVTMIINTVLHPQTHHKNHQQSDHHSIV